MLSRKALKITAGLLVAAMLSIAVITAVASAAEVTESAGEVSGNSTGEADHMTEIFGPDVKTGEDGKPVYVDENGEEHEVELSEDFKNYVDDDERFESEPERRARINQMAQEYDDDYEPPTKEQEGEGDTAYDVIIGGVTPNKKTGYLTVHADVPVNVHEEVYLYFIHMGTMKEYGIYLYEINDYTDSLCLPAGNYMVEEGGLSLDAAARYFAVQRQFRIEPCETTTLTVTIHNIDENADGTEVLKSEQEAAKEVSANAAAEQKPAAEGIEEVTTDGLGEEGEKPEEKKDLLKSILSVTFSLGVIIAIFLLAKKYLGFDIVKQNRGFDE